MNWSNVGRDLEFSALQWGCIAYWVFGIVWIFELANRRGQKGEDAKGRITRRRANALATDRQETQLNTPLEVSNRQVSVRKNMQ